MQILINHGLVGLAVMNLIAERVSLAEGETIHVLLTDDGATCTILAEGEQPDDAGDESTGSTSDSAPTGERQPKRQRRSKAQIEADKKAEEERLATAQVDASVGKSSDTPTSITSAETVTATEPAQAGAAGDTSQSEAQGPGETEVDPELAEHLANASAVEDAEADEALATGGEVPAETQAEATTAAVVEEPADTAPKAAISLFANLRKPQNG